MTESNFKTRPKILAVDDEMWNLEFMGVYLAEHGYEVIAVNGAEEALERLRRGEAFDMVLTDVKMPGKDGFQLCREIRKEKKFDSLPIILITGLQETVSKVTGLEAGADDFLSKPVDPVELGARIRAHLRIKQLLDEVESWNQILEQRVEERTRIIRQRNQELDDSYFLTMEALITALDMRECETGKHSLRVAFYAAELAREAGIHGRELEEIAMGALLHDLGKIGIPDHILLKPGKLTPEEWIKMRKHPAIGWTIIKDIEFFGRGRDLVLQHQERYDGSGYPQKLKGNEIFFGARLFSVVDTFDALMTERSYKKAMSPSVACEYIRQNKGVLFDPVAVDIFFSVPFERWTELAELVKCENFKSLVIRIRQVGGGDH